MNSELKVKPDELATLADLLRKRLDTIANAALRESDPAAHLDALRSVSEAIVEAHKRLRGRISPRLEHFLAGCSYQKALEWIENELIC